MMKTRLPHKRILLIGAGFLLLTALWLSAQKSEHDAPEIQEIDVAQMTADMHPLDHILLSYPSKSRGLKGFYLNPHQLAVDTFAIDRCEVTQGDYGRFLQWRQNLLSRTGHFALKNSPFYAEDLKEDTDWLSRTRDHKFLGRNEVPVTGIRPAAAEAYCQLTGGRLPTEFEWETAARSGHENFLYPWGNERPTTTRLFHDPILNVARECQSEPQSSTPSGIHDMGNGVSNFTTEVEDPNRPPEFAKPEKGYVAKGGGWRQPDVIHALNFLRAPVGGDTLSNYVGFRCAYPAKKSNSRKKSFYTPWRTKVETTHVQGGQYWVGYPQGSVLLQLSASVPMRQYLGLIERAQQGDQEYYVTRTEITVEQYQSFLANPIAWLGFFNHPAQPAGHQHRPLNWDAQLLDPKKPVRGVDWWSARAYAEWLGGTLPSEQEWILIADGLRQSSVEQNIGILRDPDFMQVIHNAIDPSHDVSNSNVYAVSGNVMEWTRTIVPGNSLNFILKGGSYRTPEPASQAGHASFASPEYRSMDTGFRVAFLARPHWYVAEPELEPEPSFEEAPLPLETPPLSLEEPRSLEAPLPEPN